MGNIRDKYKVNPDKEDKNKKGKETRYDVASYPFGAEELLDLRDIAELDIAESDRDDR